MRSPRKPGMLGVQIAPLNDEMREKFNLDVDESVQGVVLAAVGPGSPAEAAGLEAGDIITALNGAAVSDPQTFVQRSSRGRAGDVLTFQVLRGGKKQDVSVTLAPRPE
jgi:S1-C subfamily serine protease